MNIYYVYQLRLENSTVPFYIGKGRGRRAYDHFKPSNLSRRCHKNNVINKANRDGTKIIVEIIHHNLEEAEALSIEIETIRMYGIRCHGGLLTNATLGGEGTSGFKPSEDTRNRMAKAQTGKTLSALTRAKISESNTGKNRPPAAIAKTADGNRGKRRTSEQRLKMSKSQKGRKFSADHVERLRASKTGAKLEPAHAKAIKFAMWDRNDAWLLAQNIYESWKAHPCGHTRLQQRTGKEGLQRMHLLFKNGWVPENDSDWIIYKRKGPKPLP